MNFDRVYLLHILSRYSLRILAISLAPSIKRMSFCDNRFLCKWSRVSGLGASTFYRDVTLSLGGTNAVVISIFAQSAKTPMTHTRKTILSLQVMFRSALVLFCLPCVVHPLHLHAPWIWKSHPSILPYGRSSLISGHHLPSTPFCHARIIVPCQSAPVLMSF